MELSSDGIALRVGGLNRSELRDDYPKGFYLRVVDGRAWLRGYRCDDEYDFDPADRFVFRRA